MKNEFILLCGIPGCGKSTYAKHLIDLDHVANGIGYGLLKGAPAVIVSSNEIRDFYGFIPGTHNSEVFNSMLKSVDYFIGEGCTVIYDDVTNLSRKNRMHILENVKKFKLKRKCVLFVEPYSECRKRNCLRDPKWIVSEEEMFYLLKKFTVPMVCEGFDEIEIMQTFSGDPLDHFLDLASNFDQENPHHTLKLLDHLVATADFVKSAGGSPHVIEASLYHDIGKLWTKTFYNTMEIRTNVAHYYGHENVGAYYYLASALANHDQDSVLHVASLINWHMRPYVSMSTRKQKFERNLVGETFYSELSMLHKADAVSH